MSISAENSMNGLSVGVLNSTEELKKIVRDNLDDIKSDIKANLSNIQKETLSLFGRIKNTVVRNLSLLKGIFISGSTVAAGVAAFKGLAAVGLGALGPWGWAVIGGAFLVGLIVSGVDARIKGKNIVTGILKDLCTYTILVVASLMHKIIVDNQGIGNALGSLKDDLLGRAKEKLGELIDKIKNDIESTKINIQKDINNISENLENKKTALSTMFTDMMEKLKEEKDNVQKKELDQMLAVLKNQSENISDKIDQFNKILTEQTNETNQHFEKFLANLSAGDKDVNAIASEFKNQSNKLYDCLGKIVSGAHVLLGDIGFQLPKDIEEIMQKGLSDVFETATDQIKKQCENIITTLSDDDNKETINILKNVSKNIGNKVFSDLKENLDKLKEIKNLEGNSDIQYLVTMCNKEVQKNEHQYGSNKIEEQSQRFVANFIKNCSNKPQVQQA